ncbi:MAG: hypothetical protein WEB60_07075, partial [Terrimicrobiaceae bacterium]
MPNHADWEFNGGRSLPIPYLTTGDPNLDRAFRIACGDLTSNLVPLRAAESLTHCPVTAERWQSLTARFAQCTRLGELLPENPRILVAGLDYGPFHFDSMMHAWDGASFVVPEGVRGGLLCALQPEGERGIRGGPTSFLSGFGWTLAAWAHYLTTGSRAFLEVALAATLGDFAHGEEAEFDRETNLFRGPAIVGDGISAYPDFWAEGMQGVGHIVKWPDRFPQHRIPTGMGLPFCALSTNCINVAAYRIAARMQEELGLPVDPTLEARAERLNAAINLHFWREDAGLYRYLVSPLGGSDQQEGFGHAFAILFGIASSAQKKRIIANLHITPNGIPINWPVYPRYESPDGMTYGNHNATVWPIVTGVWAEAMAQEGQVERFALELKAHADRGCRDNQFAECYHPVSGKISGGIQEGRTGRTGEGLAAFIAARLG